MASIHYLLIVVIVFFSPFGTDTQTVLEPSKNATFLPDEQLVPADPEYDYPNVMSIKFHLLHRRIPELFTRIPLLEMECPIQQCRISMVDIVDAIQLERYSSADIANAIEKMNITARDAYNIFLIYNINASAIENLLTKAGTTFSDIYKNFVDSLHDPANTIPRILGLVNVSVFDFMNAQAYGNDSTKLEVLATGNYTLESIESVLNATNKTCIDVLKTIPLNTVAKNLRNFDAIEFKNFIKNLGITSDKLLHFYNYLNVTSTNFVAYPGYTQLLTDFEAYLNPEEVLATVTSKTKLVTSNRAKSLIKFQTENTDFVRNYSYYQAENIQNPLVHYHIKNANLMNSEYKANDIAFVDVSKAYEGNITELATIYNSSSFVNCTYVTKLPYGEIHAEHFPKLSNLNGQFVSLTKTNITLFNLGSPLFCQNKLVAIATQDSANEIQFSTFMKISSEIPNPPIPTPKPSPGNGTTPNPAGSKPGSGSTNYANFLIVLLLMILLTIQLN